MKEPGSASVSLSDGWVRLCLPEYSARQRGPHSQWPQLAAGRSDDLGTKYQNQKETQGCCSPSIESLLGPVGHIARVDILTHSATRFESAKFSNIRPFPRQLKRIFQFGRPTRLSRFWKRRSERRLSIRRSGLSFHTTSNDFSRLDFSRSSKALSGNSHFLFAGDPLSAPLAKSVRRLWRLSRQKRSKYETFTKNSRLSLMKLLRVRRRLLLASSKSARS